MATFTLVVSAAVLCTIGYGVVWAARAVGRVGMRRFAQALAALASAVITAVARLFKPSNQDTASNQQNKRGEDFINLIEDLRIAREHQRLSEEGTISPPHPYDSSGS